jgi:hypothetical protein
MDSLASAALPGLSNFPLISGDYSIS